MLKPTNTPPVPNVVSFGCRLNALNADAWREELAGFDGTLINSCAVTSQAIADARAGVRRAKRAHPDKPVWVAGCAAALVAEQFRAMPEVARVLPTPHPQAQPRKQTRARALLQIQTGCDHRCTFCIIPLARGRARSTPIADVVAQAQRLVEQGHKEIVLTGVDITSWGLDIGEAGLEVLLRAILDSVPDLPRLRLSSLDAPELNEGFLDMVIHEPRLMPHLHLSLQAGDDLILKRMKRRHSRAQAVRFCERLHTKRPDITFGADLIAGFPTETDAQHRRSLALIAECQLVWCHIFPFSAHPQTPAARMPQVPGDTIRQRASALRAEAQRVKQHWLRAQLGRHKEVLIETPTLGRAQDFTPLHLHTPAPVGALRTAQITALAGNQLSGTIV